IGFLCGVGCSIISRMKENIIFTKWQIPNYTTEVTDSLLFDKNLSFHQSAKRHTSIFLIPVQAETKHHRLYAESKHHRI
ncbi:hypothetical protein ACJX0J_026808, partial [Zea mays]